MKRIFQLILLTLFIFVSRYTNAQPSFQLVNVQALDTVLNYGDELRIVSMMEYSGVQQNTTEALQIGCQTTHNGVVKINILANFNQQVFMQQPSGTIDVDTIVIPINSIYFSDGGGHTVIVWPIIGSTNADIDSTTIGTPIIITSWLNQQEWATEKQARIFPVPANEFIMLEKPNGKANITILDIQGRVVTTILSNEKQIRIPLSHLSSGNYYVRYSDGINLPEIHAFIKE